VVDRTAGVRQADSKESDFYAQVAAEAVRQGKGSGTVSTAHLLPKQADVERYLAETATRAVQVLRQMVVKVIALSQGRQALPGRDPGPPRHRRRPRLQRVRGIPGHHGGRNPGPRVIAVILDAVPGIAQQDWLPEPGGAAGITPSPGQITWSAIIPPDTQARILADADADAVG
jgi:hypothetical protein